MIGQKRIVWGILALTAGFISSASLATAMNDQGTTADSVRIGMVSSLFRDTPETLITALMHPFAALMETQTGIAGQMVCGGDAVHLGQLLADDKVQIAVFHGVEFAWAKQQHPELRALMIAVNQERHLYAHILVRSDADLVKFADLKGKTLALPRRGREHCHLFLENHCRETGQSSCQFFGGLTAPASAEDALDDVVDKVVTATLVDGVALECYQRRKPGRFAQLKVVLRSEAFPAAAVAYHPGILDEVTLEKFRAGLINANKGALGRQFMTLWKLTGFEPVPADYDKNLMDILKSYPVPAKSFPTVVLKPSK